jgi:hypothetical protein
MAANTSPIFELTPTCGTPQTFTDADTTDKKTLVTGGTNATRIDSIMCSTDDTAAVNLAFYISISGTDYYIGNVNVPIGSGYTTVARVEAMTTLSPALGYLVLPASALLKANCVATMTSAKTTTVVPVGGDY